MLAFIMSPIMMTGSSNLNSTKIKAGYCYSSADCHHGVCISNICECDNGYITWKDSEVCSYEQYAQLGAFLLSFFLGGLGVDWFVLAKGNAGYIVAGVFKLLTLGGLGIWWLADVIRLGINTFNDGNGAPLKPW